MDNLERIFDNLYESMSQPQAKRFKTAASQEGMDSLDSSESLDIKPSGPQEEFELQSQIRPLFGKESVNNSPIGTHPDFIALEGTDTIQLHYACTIFVDIKGSTRLSLLYPLDFVFLFKNAVIKACIETIRSFDGHVHRLMGDAVMAFFGSKTTDKEDAIADAINCCITLRTILEGSIKPWMEKRGLDSRDFGFRVGCDFGDDHEVLWGSFGYKNVGEVSATGLPVDMASKLQGLAGKNQTMLGQGALDFVNWPEKYSEIKTREKGGEKEKLPIVTPSITNADGTPLNYKMRLLSYEKSLEFSALPREIRQKISGSQVIDHPLIKYKCYTVSEDRQQEYISASRFLEPHISLKFEVTSLRSTRLNYPLKVSFSKTNHGQATPEGERNIEQKATHRQLDNPRNSPQRGVHSPYAQVELSEVTLYRGLHTMKCEVRDNNGALIFRDWIGVMIK